MKAYQEQYKYLQQNIHTFEKVAHETHVDESTYPLTVYKDPNTGETWLYKQAGKKGSQAEALAYQIGQLINPGDRVAVFAGDLASRIRQESGTFQKYIPQDFIASYKYSPQMGDPKVMHQQLIREQVVDQFLGNWDTHQKNFLEAKNGRLIFIDKGQSFKFYKNGTYGNDLSASYWGYQGSAKAGTVYERLEQLLHGNYSRDTQLFSIGADKTLDVREEVAPVLSNIQKLFSTKKNVELIEKMVQSTITDGPNTVTIFNGLKERALKVNEKFDALYAGITGDPSYKVSANVSPGKKIRAKKPVSGPPTMSDAIRDMVEKIFPDVSIEHKRVFASAYERYAERPVELLSQSSFFKQHHPQIAECLNTWEGSSSAADSIFLKAMASKLEGLGDILLNSRRFGEQPSGWRGLEHWYNNYVKAPSSTGFWPEELEAAERLYIEARAYVQAYVRKAYPDGMPTLYRGARIKSVRDLLVDPDASFPVEVREQTIASFSRNKRKADTFGTGGEEWEGYVYNIKNLPYEDVTFTDKQLPGGYANEQEIMVRSKKGRKITREQLSIIKNEMVRRMLLCSNEEWQEYLQKKQTPLSASVLDLSRRLLKSYVSSYIKGKG
jgi:hypothetical protein